MFGFGGIWKRKPRQFEYRPLFYDPEKEEREERKKKVLGEDKPSYSSLEEKKEYVPGQYIRRNTTSRREHLADRRKKLPLPLAIVILILLLAAIYWVLS